jgi:vitamin B12 transporter
MTKKHLFILLTAVFPTAIHAQDTTKFSSLDEIVFSANKYPNKTSLTGKVVNVISREQLERAGAKDLSQVLNEQVGLYLNGANSNAGKDKTVFLRGAKGDHTLITIDGVPVYDATGIGSNFDIRLIPIDNIERIEILKGSQSTLYGSDAIAGVINIITRKHLNKIVKASGVISYGSYNTWNASTTLTGKKNKFDYNIGYSHLNTKGIDETIDTIHSVNRDKDGYKQHNIQVNFGVQVSKAWYIKPNLRFSHLHADLDQGAFTDELDYTSTLKNLQAGLRQEINLSKGKLILLYNYNHNSRLYIDDSTKSQNGFSKYSKGEYKSKEHYAEAYVTLPLIAAIQLTAGIDFRQSSTGQNFFSDGSFGPFESKLGKDSLNHKQVGIYGAANFKFGKLNIETGGRLNNHSEYRNKFVYSVNPSYLLNHLNQRFKLFFNLSSAFRTPSLYQLYSEYGNRNLKPESGITVEGGGQYFDASDKFTARITYFKRNIKDVIFFYFDPVTFRSIYINQDKQKDHGFEIESSINIYKKTMLKLMYTYVDGNTTTKTNGKDSTYFNLLRRPRSVFGAYLESQVTKAFYISTHVRSTGKTFDMVGFPAKDITLENYILWSIYAEYGFLNNKLKVFTDLRNISDVKYSEVYGYNSPGFNMYAGLRFNF